MLIYVDLDCKLNISLVCGFNLLDYLMGSFLSSRHYVLNVRYYISR